MNITPLAFLSLNLLIFLMCKNEGNEIYIISVPFRSLLICVEPSLSDFAALLDFVLTLSALLCFIWTLSALYCFISEICWSS